MLKIRRKKLSVAVVNALNAGVVVGLAAPLAYAQQTAIDTAQAQRIEKIEVTGSRIPSPTITSESPVNVINAQDIKYTGITQTSDIINQLPQAAADQGNNLANGSVGTSTINLRGLGPQRTLVLIDGKRVPAGSPNYWATDVNAIPAPLIQRVEVLTGGASSIYGSDAIAGVVNFIMNDHFEGVQFDWTGSGYNHQQHSFVGDLVAARQVTNPQQFQVPGNVGLDGRTQDFSMTLGSNFANGKGNATVYFEYRNVDPVLQNKRDFSECSLVGGTTAYTCGGSSTSFPGRFTDFSNFDFTIANAQGGVRPYVGATDTYNFAPTNYYQRPDRRYLANFFAHYDVDTGAKWASPVRVYTEFDFMDDHTRSQIAPSGAFLQPFTLNVNNPLLSQQFKDTVGLSAANPNATFYIGRRNVEGGGRTDDIRHTDYRVVIGAKGDVFDGKWDYNFWWQSGKVVFQRTYLNDFSVVRLGRAFNVVPDTRSNAPVPGAPVCASLIDGSDINCVPYNIFSLGGVTQAQLNYLQTPGVQTGTTEQSVVGAVITSDLGSAYGVKSPWARNGVGVAFGIERRVEKLNTQVDVEFDTGDLAGQGGATHAVSGQFTVVEPYAEIRIPIMERQPWAYNLEATGSYRYSNYSTDKTTNTYGLGAKWAPIKEVEARGSYQQAVRAANIIELFTAQGFNLFNGGDPCGGATPTATLEQCLRTGLLPSQYGSNALISPAGQYNYIQGGNPNLDPETAKTYTFGMVFQPIANMSATIDYWHYFVSDVIGRINSQLAINNCISIGLNCDLIHRGPNGNLWLPNQGFVTGTNQNLGSIKTDGIDITFNYLWPLPPSWGNYGSLAFNLAGTWVNSYVTTPVPGLASYDCAGFFGPTCGIPVPEWRHRFQTVWNTPWNVNLALTWRYTDGVDLDFTSSNPQLNAASSPLDAHIGSFSYFDLALQWNVDKTFTIRAGVNNMFDKDPPVVSSTAGAFPAISGPALGNGNTYPQVYDTLGRAIFLNVTAKF
jgi:outer membrane receptor protein involved in Fe transport